jgi:methionyl-tRNA synthetase
MVDISSLLNPMSSTTFPQWLLVVLLVWTGVWKGIALWKSAQKKRIIWFIAFLVINTLGILEILYIFLISRITDSSQQKLLAKKTRGK